MINKKKGLRSFRNTVILLGIILVIPLIVLFITNTYFIAPSICPEYKEILQRAKSNENGYPYFKEAVKHAEEIFRGYFPQMKCSGIWIGKEGKAQYSEPKEFIWHPSDYYSLFWLLIVEKLLLDEIDAYSQQKYKISKKVNVDNQPYISSGNNWGDDFLKVSQVVLKNIKKANQKNISFPMEMN